MTWVRQLGLVCIIIQSLPGVDLDNLWQESKNVIASMDFEPPLLSDPPRFGGPPEAVDKIDVEVNPVNAVPKS